MPGVNVLLRRCRRPLVAAAILLLGLQSAWADKIVTINGQTLEGVIREENEYVVNIDVRGIIIPVPRKRIKEVVKNTADENVRFLLDRALEALSRDDIMTARTLVEQARLLNSQDPTLQNNFIKLDEEITDLERRGGTPEERQRRAEALLARATEAYDRIKTEEGNRLLIQALKTEPTLEAAHRLMTDRLTKTGRPDLLLAAEYFTQVMWPDHLRNDSPVIMMLPTIFTDLVQRFKDTEDIHNASQYWEMLNIISQAFEKNPLWKNTQQEDVRALLDRPLLSLLSEQIEANIKNGYYDQALQKLKIWAQPQDSPQLAILFVRAQMGNGNLTDAEATVSAALTKYPDQPELVKTSNALNILTEAEKAGQGGKTDEAIADLNKIFAIRDTLVPEIVEMAGQRLASIRAAQIPAAATSTNAMEAADTAAVVMRYSEDQALRQQAAVILSRNLSTIPWKLELNVTANGQPLTAPPEIVQQIQAMLTQPLGVRFAAESPFVLAMQMDLHLNNPNGPAVLQEALQAGPTGPLKEPIVMNGVQFSLVASHPSLGILYQDRWSNDLLSAPQSPHVAAMNLQTVESLSNVISQVLPQILPPELRVLTSHLKVPHMNELIQEKTAAQEKRP